MNLNHTENKSLADFIQNTLSENISSIRIELDGVIQNSDIEFVHRIRIAIRRYRNNLQIFKSFGNQELFDSLQGLHQHTNEFSALLAQARDLDIQHHLIELLFDSYDSTSKTSLLNYFSKHRQNVQILLSDLINNANNVHFINEYDISQDISKSTESAILVASGPLKAVSSSIAMSISLLNPMSGITDAEEIHRFRKSIRRVRYTLECFQNQFDFPTIQMIEKSHQIQDLLGDLHDLDMLKTSTDQINNLTKSDIEFMNQIIKGKREPLYQTFLLSLQSGEIMDFLHQLLHRFEQEIKESTGNNHYENRTYR
ncbi:MAG: CHAD domain-containing protein [Anaerolineaceae bacterium]|nr:CHAD domain-containing protein [Anaerolineaceae bacterium]